MPVSGGTANVGKRSPPRLAELSEFPPLGECEASRLSEPMFDEEGIIEYVRDVYGFVRFKRYPSESACFHRDDEARYLGRRVKYATDVFKVGDVARFDALPNQRTQGVAKWRVTAFHYVQGVPGWASPKPCREWDSDENDKSREITGLHGVVDRIKSEYGFIRLGPHSAPAAFFRVGVLEQSMEKTVDDVSEVLAVGDLVRFDAELNLKDNTSAKWWVTYVRPVSASTSAAPLRGGVPRLKELGKPSDREGPNGTSGGPRNAGVVRNNGDDDDDSDDSDVDQNSWPPPKGNEKKILPWSYARCAARAVAPEGVTVPNTSAPTKAPPAPSLTSTLSKTTSSLARPSVLVYRGVRGIAKRVDGGAAIECEVRESTGLRRVKLGDDCPFYRNGVRSQADGGGVAKALGEGDQLTLDYVVAADVASPKNADVHCCLAWQGDRPSDVPHLSLELLRRVLKAGCDQNIEKTADTDAQRDRVKAKKTTGRRASTESSSESSEENGSDVVGAAAAPKTTNALVLSEDALANMAEMIVKKLSGLLEAYYKEKQREEKLKQEQLEMQQQLQQQQQQQQQQPHQQPQQQPQPQPQPQQQAQQQPQQQPQPQPQQQRQQRQKQQRKNPGSLHGSPAPVVNSMPEVPSIWNLDSDEFQVTHL